MQAERCRRQIQRGEHTAATALVGRRETGPGMLSWQGGSARGLIKHNVYPGVAQLVARVVWDHDAAGSNPVTRTRGRRRKVCGFCFASKARAAWFGHFCRARPVGEAARRKWRSGQNLQSEARSKFWEPQGAAKPTMPQVRILSLGPNLFGERSSLERFLFCDRIREC